MSLDRLGNVRRAEGDLWRGGTELQRASGNESGAQALELEAAALK